MTSFVTPSISSTSFNCPHCRVLAQQFWWKAFASKLAKDTLPSVWRPEEAELRISELEKNKENSHDMTAAFAWVRKAATGEVFFSDKNESNWSFDITNLAFSKCYHCERVAVWIHDRLVFPAGYDAPPANVDMPPDVMSDYAEAGAIAGNSPRGAAALLRLALQHLMPHLGERGKDLNDDIASLVRKGLDPRIQRALDIVRVTGNNAVHPGQISFEDNPDTVASLFKLLNVIVDSLISQPNEIADTYAGLPKGARAQIEQRDNQALPKPDDK